MSNRLEMSGLSLKSGQDVLFPSLNLKIEAGECLGLLGAGGTGRSLLLRSLCGLARGETTTGSCLLNEQELTQQSSSKALRQGVFYLAPRPVFFSEMSLWENLYLAEMSGGRTLWSHHKLKGLASELFERLKLDFDIEAKGFELSHRQKFWLSWARFHLRERKLLLIDESSSKLTGSDSVRFREELLRFKSQGGIVIYALPGLSRDDMVCDRFLFVSKEKQEIQERKEEDVTQKIRVELLQPQEKEKEVFPPKVKVRQEKLIMKASNYSCQSESNVFFKDISFDLRPGEILGIYGSEESGRVDLFFSFFGALRRFKRSGKIEIDGREFVPSGPLKAVKEGLAFVSGFRSRYGLFPNLSVGTNLALPSNILNHFFSPISSQKEKLILDHYRQLLRLKVKSLSQMAGELHNDEQQKITLGRWLMLKPRIFFLDEPLRGLTQTGRQEIAYLIRQLSDEGISFVIGSSDFVEQFSLCHRMLVMKRSEIIGELGADEMNKENLFQISRAKNEENSIGS